MEFDNGEIKKYIYEIGATKVEQINVSDIKFNVAFRKICENNVCKNYNNSYVCPPIVGTPEQVIEKVNGFKNAIVYQVVEPIRGFADHTNILKAEEKIADITIKLNEKMKNYYSGRYMILGAICCKKCTPCNIVYAKPCSCEGDVFPSVSAYCIDVENLAEKCNMHYSWEAKTISYFAILLIKD